MTKENMEKEEKKTESGQKAKTEFLSIGKSIRQCVDTGKVIFGSKRSIKKALLGKAKAFIVAKNCPKEISQDINYFAKLSNIPIIQFEGSSLELGMVAGRPHPIAIMAILDQGNSNILDFAK